MLRDVPHVPARSCYSNSVVRRKTQLAMFPPVKMTASHRLAMIRERLQGFSTRQAARVQRRREQRRRSKKPAAESIQVTLEELLAPGPSPWIPDRENS